MHEGSRKAIVAAFFANLGIALSKIVGFVLTGSAGMLAEAVHSIADTGNQGLLMLGGRRATKEASQRHPFGFSRERYFFAFVLALVLFTLGGAFAIYEGIEKLIHPHELDSVWIAIGLLSAAVVMESLSFRTAIREANPMRGRNNWWQFIRQTRSPELPVVLLEDFAALIGLAVALTGVALAKITGNPRWDAVGSLAIGLLLCAVAVLLATEMKSLLIGESATVEVENEIVARLASAPRVQSIIHLRTQHLGPDDLLVVAKLEFDSTLTMAELATAIDEAERQLREAVPQARLVFIEPDINRGSTIQQD
ncbi:MAG: cation diffusion facilitator family transporter [Acidimicrobiia bacterium]|nr:cation diffusion facilitator family transporter [Acidimicrobiia bacterium]